MPEKVISCRDKDNNFRDIESTKMSFRPSVYGIIIKDKHVLLLPHYDDGYDFPGGGMELGESLEDALKREVKEETGLDVTPGEIVHVSDEPYYFVHKDYAAHTLLFFYACTDPKGTLTTNGFDEAEKEYASLARWIPLDEVDDAKFYNPVDSAALIHKVQTALRVVDC